MSKPLPQTLLLALLLGWANYVSALGLGDIHADSAIGDRFLAQVKLIAPGANLPEASCFSLNKPADDSLPWLKRAKFSLRRGPPAVLEIRSPDPVNDPIFNLSISVACGHELQRSYTLMLSPGKEYAGQPSVPVSTPLVGKASESLRPRPPSKRREITDTGDAATPPLPRRRPVPSRDRLVLSGGGEWGDSTLRLSTELSSPKETPASSQDVQRELLRLEYRTLQALNDQASSQLSSAEKLRAMEANLAQLQQQVSSFTQRLETGDQPAQGAAAAPPAPPPLPEAPPVSTVPASPEPASGSASPSSPPAALSSSEGAVPPEAPSPPPEAASPPEAAPATPPAASVAIEAPVPAPPPERSGSNAWFYGMILAAVAALAAWLGWRRHRSSSSERNLFSVPDPVIDPRRANELGEPSRADLPMPPPPRLRKDPPAKIDFNLDDASEQRNSAQSVSPSVSPSIAPSRRPESQFSVASATVDEHFEANPVMELAEIMLSFGRVKGAAQALQEFVDHNPEEAVQPWIRLLEVYRMAGMREEYQRVAENFNKHFNVEVCPWEQEARPAGGSSSVERAFGDDEAKLAPVRAVSLEYIPHICHAVVETWQQPSVLEYLNRLLRDNRHGTRTGFPLEVIEEILFLIDLKEAIMKTEH